MHGVDVFFSYFPSAIYDTHRLIFFSAPPPAHPAHGIKEINVDGWCFCMQLKLISCSLIFALVYSLHCFILPTVIHGFCADSHVFRNNEINVGGGWCCTHIFGPWCSPAEQGLFADAHRLTKKCWWWVVLVVVKRRAQQPTSPPINTHRPVPTRPPCKVA